MRILHEYATCYVTEETLTDGSVGYDLVVRTTPEHKLPCHNRDHALCIAKALDTCGQEWELVQE